MDVVDVVDDVPRPVCCVTAGLFIEPGGIQGTGGVDWSMNKTWIFSWLREPRDALDFVFHSLARLSC